MSAGPARPPRRPRIAYLSNSSGAYDARSQRMARSAVDAGFEVTLYARLQEGLPAVEEREGYRIVRASSHRWLAYPILRRVAWRRIAGSQARAAARAAEAATAGAPPSATLPTPDSVSPAGMPPAAVQPPAAQPPGASPRPGQRLRDAVRRSRELLLRFPIRPMAWAEGLDRVVEPADIWHGMWAGSLPALVRLSARHGGRTIYDSRDVYMESRDFARASRPLRRLLAAVERRYARRVDRVLTVNEAYADLIERGLGVRRPPVVMNCSARWTPPDPRPDLIRAALGLPPSTRIALYQGQLSSERGIEEAMDAILEVPEAVLVLLGFGKWKARLAEMAAAAPYVGRVFLLPPVPPDDLLAWTASADVSVMAIAPTTVNHQHTTPQKLLESLAAGVPVVASDLPGMASIVRATGCGVLVDPTSPASIAEGIRTVVTAPADERAALRRRVLEAAHRDYSWEPQLETLMAVYSELLAADGLALPAAR